MSRLKEAAFNMDISMVTATNPPSDAKHSASPPLSPQETGQMVQLLKLFADETRIRILSQLLQQGEANVQTLCRHLGQTQPAVSHHLALLKEAGMVRMRRSGKHNFYRVDSSPRDRIESALAPLFALQNGAPKA